MAVAKIFDFDEAKAIARKHETLHSQLNEINLMLAKFDEQYDYIFEILQHDMREGDLKTTGNPCSIDSIIQDGDYRIYKKSYQRSRVEYVDFAVFKVLNINNQDFMIGFEVSSNFFFKALSIGCFDHKMQLTGYGTELKASRVGW